MRIEKSMNDLERHIDYTTSYFADVKSELEDLDN
jgi:hypothetical protein